jgi:hypothetical protein
MEKRITLICGHYGSGKTEVSVNYAIYLSSQEKKTALIDLDIANPYFRSRESRSLLTSKGVEVYGDAFGYDTTMDLPALTAGARRPLENKDIFSVVDAGGDAAGARVLNQFRKYFLSGETEVICVVNFKRPETSTFEGIESHMAAIQAETGLTISGIINNTHLLRETTCEVVLDGVRFAEKLAEEFQIPIKFHTCQENLFPEVSAQMKKKGIESNLFPLTLYMRPTWLDR